MQHQLTMVYWKGEKYCLGKAARASEITTQGETLDELEQNLKDAYLTMAMEDVPPDYKTKDIAV